MRFDILTIFPELLRSALGEGILRRAIAREQIRVNLVNIRDFATDRQQMTDDRPFGGGEGMVMKPEPLTRAVAACRREEHSRTVLLSPQGAVFDQQKARRLAEETHLILICGRYEGVDQRFIDAAVDEELSIGNYILTGGEPAALVVVDAVSRLLPGVLGCADSTTRDSFSRSLLKHPQYTRPREFDGVEVPAELLSGDHRRISRWRFCQSVRATLDKRPELLTTERFTPEEIRTLKHEQLWQRVRAVQQKQNDGSGNRP